MTKKLITGQKLRSFQDILLGLHWVLGRKTDAFPRISVGRLRILPEPSATGNDRFHWLLHRLATFSVDFCILYAECPPYFYFRFVWPTDLKSIPNASTLTSIIPTKFEVDMTIHCQVIAFLSADMAHDLVTLTCDSCYTWRVTRPTLPPSMKTIRSWVMSYNVSHWLPLKMHTRPLRMRRITWPVSRGCKKITFLESPTPICLFAIPLLFGYNDD